MALIASTSGHRTGAGPLTYHSAVTRPGPAVSGAGKRDPGAPTTTGPACVSARIPVTTAVTGLRPDGASVTVSPMPIPSRTARLARSATSPGPVGNAPSATGATPASPPSDGISAVS